jgi:hypothetical protein
MIKNTRAASHVPRQAITSLNRCKLRAPGPLRARLGGQEVTKDPKRTTQASGASPAAWPRFHSPQDYLSRAEHARPRARNRGPPAAAGRPPHAQVLVQSLRGRATPSAPARWGLTAPGLRPVRFRSSTPPGAREPSLGSGSWRPERHFVTAAGRPNNQKKGRPAVLNSTNPGAAPIIKKRGCPFWRLQAISSLNRSTLRLPGPLPRAFVVFPALHRPPGGDGAGPSRPCPSQYSSFGPVVLLSKQPSGRQEERGTQTMRALANLGCAWIVASSARVSCGPRLYLSWQDESQIQSLPCCVRSSESVKDQN